jgi:hypothetical protein
MIFLEIFSKKFKNAVLSEVKRPSYTGIIGIYGQLRSIFKNKQPIILQVIEFLEKNRVCSIGDKLNNYIDQCVINRQCLLRLQNRQADIEYFDNLERKFFAS